MKAFLACIRASIGRPLCFLPLLVCLAACANTTYIPVENGTKTVGKGAVLRKVNGIDVWSDGQPPRPYQIVGVIHDRRSALRKGDLLKDVANAAKKMHGDAILTYQDYGATAGGVTSGAAAATQNALMLGALASGPAVTFVGPVAAVLSATQGGQSRWWVAKYLPEKPKASLSGGKPRSTSVPNQFRTLAAPRPPSAQASNAPNAQ